MFHCIKDFKDIYEKRALILTLAESDFKKKFVGSFLGVCWMFVQPITTVLIYFFVFQMGFKSQPVQDVPYVLWLIPGIVPWFFFNEYSANNQNYGFIFYTFNIYMDHAHSLSTIWNETIALVASIDLLFILYSFLSLGAVIYYFFCKCLFQRYRAASSSNSSNRDVGCTYYVG